MYPKGASKQWGLQEFALASMEPPLVGFVVLAKVVNEDGKQEVVGHFLTSVA